MLRPAIIDLVILLGDSFQLVLAIQAGGKLEPSLASKVSGGELDAQQLSHLLQIWQRRH